MQDIPENGADVAHLACVHTAGVSSGADTDYKDRLPGKLHTHKWSVKWEALPEPHTHIGRTTLTLTNVLFGLEVKALTMYVTADQVGPGEEMGCKWLCAAI